MYIIFNNPIVSWLREQFHVSEGLGISPSAGVMQDAAFLNMVKSKREYEEANMGMGMGQHMSAPISDGNTKSWQKHI